VSDLELWARLRALASKYPADSAEVQLLNRAAARLQALEETELRLLEAEPAADALYRAAPGVYDGAAQAEDAALAHASGLMHAGYFVAAPS
jgi:hypothetical protein